MVGSNCARGAEEEGGDRADREREPHGDGIDAPVVDAHQLGDLDVVGGGAEGAAEAGAVEDQVQRENDEDRGNQAKGAA